MLLVEPRLCTMADCCGDEVGLRQSLDKISRFYRDACEWNPPAIDVGERLAGKSMRQYVSTSRRFARGAGVDAGPSDGKNASCSNLAGDALSVSAPTLFSTTSSGLMAHLRLFRPYRATQSLRFPDCDEPRQPLNRQR
jgi:hypothetical protein